MSSLEMTGVMGILAAWETDGREVHQGLNATISGLFQSGNICGAPASFITLARYPGLQGRGEFTEKLFDLENLPTRGRKRRATHWKVFRVLRSVEGGNGSWKPRLSQGKRV